MKYGFSFVWLLYSFQDYDGTICTEFELDGPQLAITDPDMVKHVSSNTHEAKRDGFRDAILEAAIAGASFCR